jgi:hypothetical protein
LPTPFSSGSQIFGGGAAESGSSQADVFGNRAGAAQPGLTPFGGRPAAAGGGLFGEVIEPQGSILRNSISAENLSDKFSSSNFAKISTQKYVLKTSIKLS